jgi:hypothetical protein
MTPNGWETKENGIKLRGLDDVYVEFVDTDDGRPFIANVGAAEGRFPNLADALNWAEEAALGRAVVLGQTPPVLVDQTSDSDPPQFLTERGLRG